MQQQNSIEKAWRNLTTEDDVEFWVSQHNKDLQRSIANPNAKGCGVCFCLAHGGEIYMHTTEGAILLDVTPEAEWAAPVIAAATGIEAPQSRIWVLPDNVLLQLMLGLNSLIAATRIVLSHDYKGKRY